MMYFGKDSMSEGDAPISLFNVNKDSFENDF